ncbi:MAG: biopolymer transporter ExbD [Verrucomicrobiota bacterium]|nr:biopolymer transporter ExbD [Verrucomicrobiota bacterium]
MKRSAYAEQMTEGSVDVNMAPLIDCVFLLLIFFITTTVFVEETGVEVQKPKAVSARDLERNSILIALTADGKIVYGGRQIDLNSVRGVVAQQLRDKDLPVIVFADDASRSGRLVDLIDECKIAGAKHVSVAAGKEY